MIRPAYEVVNEHTYSVKGLVVKINHDIVLYKLRRDGINIQVICFNLTANGHGDGDGDGGSILP